MTLECRADLSSVTKIYSTISGCRYQTDLRDAKARGYLAHLPHYNAVFKIPRIRSVDTLPIESDFAVDSSGFSTGQFMRWLDVKYGLKKIGVSGSTYI
jgi:hypothetical protein